jgi:site-specific DNA-adenine methylase
LSELTIPCAYQGGKQRIAKPIVSIIKQYIKDDNTQFYDLCCGSGAVSIELVNQGFNPANIHMVEVIVLTN